MKGREEKTKMNSKLIMDYNDKPKAGQWVALSFQHVFAMFSATVLVPMLTGMPISTALFSSGVGTLIYILCTKGRVPMYLGSSFAYISYICTALATSGQGLGAVLTGVLVVGVIYCLVALAIKIFGVAWLNRLLPPIVVGPMILVIGLSLSASAVNNTGMVIGTNADGSAMSALQSFSYYWKDILCALFTMVVTAVIAIRGKGILKITPFLFGILAGYICGLVLYFIPGGRDGFMDFSALVQAVTHPAQWFSLPKLTILGWKDSTGVISMAKINFSAALTVIPLAFATICEHVGDHEVLGKITGKNYIEKPGLHRTLLGDGLATAFAGLVGSVPNTSYGENTAVVGMTKIGSVWVTGGAAVLAVILSFFNVFVQLIATIPSAVMGGLCLILYGFIGFNGLKVLFDARIDMTATRNSIIISVMLVIGLGGATFLGFSGMALASIFGILLNLLLPKGQEEKAPQAEDAAQ